MQEAKNELKNLMNELFVEDLKENSKELRDNITKDFEGAVGEFKKNYNKLIADAAIKVIDPKVEQLRTSISELRNTVTTNNDNLTTKINNIKDELEEKLNELIKIQNENTPKLDAAKTNTEKAINDIKDKFSAQKTTSDNLISNIKSIETKVSNESKKVFDQIVADSKSIIEKVNNESSINKERNTDLVNFIKNEVIKQINENTSTEIKTKSIHSARLSQYLIALTIIETLLLLYIIFMK
ncbi:MAG: hypothetical protein M0P71_06390 [Melioribacteraceae bacterium]|nr:hypothetical protein [Melioribacteraceae bacterium]